MNKVLSEAATKIRNSAIEQWVSSGKKAVGYTCSFVPVEIMHAAGILPVRLRGIEASSLEIGDAYFGPFICTFPKCILQLAGDGTFSFLNGMIITPGCDAMRRLDECWRKAGDDHPGIVPPFFFHFGVPHKVLPHSLKWFTDECRRLADAVSDSFGSKVTNDSLHHAIKAYNEGRKLMSKLEDLRTLADTPVSGTEAFTAAVAGTTLPRPVFNRLIAEFISEASGRKPGAPGRKRLMVAGSVSDDVALIQLFEDAGAVVVAENLCFGIRNENDLVDETGDPVAALAKRYLSQSTCPRMFGGYKVRLKSLLDKAARANVDGVILQNVRFCDMHGSENGLFERDLEKAGIPCLKLEREYGQMVETGRIRMRVDAFLERIA